MTTQSHNPDNLTEWGQSKGWRLLTVEEVKTQQLPADAEYFDPVDKTWSAIYFRKQFPIAIDQERTTYRTREPLPSQPDDALSYYEKELPAVIAGVRRGEKWEYSPNPHAGWYLPGDQGAERLSERISGGYRVRLAPVPVVKPWSVAELIEKYDDLREFTRQICLQLQKYRGLSDDQKDELFQFSYRMYVKHEVERQPRPCVKPEGGK